MNDRSFGFTLIELSIYLALGAMSAALLFGVASRIQVMLKKTQTRVAHYAAVHAASDVFARDILSAPGSLDEWKKVTPHALVWSQGDLACGWFFDDGVLTRYEGHYSSRGSWSRGSKGLAADNIYDVQFIVQQKKIDDGRLFIDFVQVKIELNNDGIPYKIERRVHPRVMRYKR